MNLDRAAYLVYWSVALDDAARAQVDKDAKSRATLRGWSPYTPKNQQGRDLLQEATTELIRENFQKELDHVMEGGEIASKTNPRFERLSIQVDCKLRKKGDKHAR